MTKKRGGRARQLALWVALAMVACTSRTGLDPRDHELSTCWPDCQQTWGDFAATLDVPDCPTSNPVLTVNTTADELDGGLSITDPAQAGDRLSFLEALWIAANRGTPHNIYFDAEVFPTASPGRIAIGDSASWPSLSQGCVDARGRGVVIQWPDTSHTWTLRASSRVVGLDFENTTLWHVSLESTAQLAACRFEGGGDLAIAASPGATVGPGNVIQAGWRGVDVTTGSGASAEIRGNYFAFDPTTRTADNDNGDTFIPITLFYRANIEANTFGPHAATIMALVSEAVTPTAGTLHGNFFCVGADGAPLPGRRTGIVVGGGGAPLQVGPDNTVHGCEGAGVTIFNDVVDITRNSISGNAGGGIVVEVPSIAPTITAAAVSHTAGTCPVAGRLELFADPGDQGVRYLTGFSCISGEWNTDAHGSAGEYVTATLTVDGTTGEFSVPVAVF